MKLIYKSLILAALVGLTQTGMYINKGGDKRFLPSAVKEYDELLAKKPTLVYFGDSVNRSAHGNDKDKRPISDMIAAQIPGAQPANLDHAAYAAELYRSFLKNMVRSDHKPEYVVIPINMRSFSAGWRYRPEYQFAKERAVLDYDFFLFRAFFKPLAILKAIKVTPITQGEYEQKQVMDGDAPVGPVKDFTGEAYETVTDERMKNKFIFNYMYHLDQEDPRLQALCDIARILKKESIPYVFYITPVDVAEGEKFLGPRLTQRVKDNAAKVVQALQAEGVDVLDLTTALPSDAFNWRVDLYPNEHLNEKGRKFVAGQVAERITTLN